MFQPKQLLSTVIGKSTDSQAAETFLVKSGAEFRVRAHEGWCRYDASAHTLVDPARGNAVVPCRIEDITQIRFGEHVIDLQSQGATQGSGDRGQVKDPEHDRRLKENNPDAGKAGGEARADQMAQGSEVKK